MAGRIGDTVADMFAALIRDANTATPPTSSQDLQRLRIELNRLQAIATPRTEVPKGTDIPADTTLPLGNDDYYHVTGTTSIVQFTAKLPGTVVWLEFDDAVTLFHDDTWLILQNGVNYTTHAGDIFGFISEGTGWREISRRLAVVSGDTDDLTEGDVVDIIGSVLTDSDDIEWKVDGEEITGTLTPKPEHTDLQSFTVNGSYTWMRPTWFTPKFVRVVVYGAGGGGGGGASNTGLVARCGGCGGGGAARAERTYKIEDLAYSEPVVIGAGGAGGAGGASGASGSIGTAGGSSTFSSGVNLLSTFGGGGGAIGVNSATAESGGAGGGLNAVGGNGSTSAASGGTPGVPTAPNGGCGASSFSSSASPPCAEYGGGAGGGHTLTPFNGLGGSSLFGGAGGGAGGGSDATPALVVPTAGGAHVFSAGGGGAAGTSGAAPTPGSAGANGNMYTGGYGGGGGGGTITANTTGNAGGAGGTPGGGGGGGGVGSNTGLGGAGGKGGDGAVYIISW